jgi:cation diffusion facilitator family transporter
MPQRAAAVSVAANSALILLKLVVGLATRSVSVVSEALHSLVDLAAAVIALYAVRKSAEPADDAHPYGHGKFESMSGAAEGLLVFLAAAAILFQAGRALLLRHYLSTAVGGLIAMGLSVAVNLVLSIYLYRVARASESLAIEADGLHHLTDLYSCIGVFVGLAVIEIAGFKWLDPLLAIMVAGVITIAAYRLTGRSVSELLDTSLPEDERDRLTQILEAHSELGISFHRVRARRSGPLRHIDLHLETPPDMTVQRAHEICDHLEQDIVAALPRARVLIHTEPLGNKTD